MVVLGKKGKRRVTDVKEVDGEGGVPLILVAILLILLLFDFLVNIVLIKLFNFLSEQLT